MMQIYVYVYLYVYLRILEYAQIIMGIYKHYDYYIDQSKRKTKTKAA